MNTRFVETFVLLARIGHLRRVAEQLHATPGAISLRVRSLERELGVTLFDWDHKRLQLTAEGAQLLRHAEDLLEAERTLERVAKSGSGAVGRIRVGMIESAVHTCLPDFMKLVTTQLPQVQIDLQVDLTSRLSDELMRREVDLIFCVASGGENPYVVSEDVMELPMHWVAKRGLVPQKDVLKKVFQRQVLTLMRGTVPFESSVALVRRLAEQQGLVSSDLRIGDSPTIAALVSLVREGVGVGLMPGLLVKEHLDRGELVQLALPRPEPFRLAMVYPKNFVPSVGRVVEVARKATDSYCKRLGETWVRATT